MVGISYALSFCPSVSQQTYDICEESGLTCPISAGGEVVAETSQSIPTGAPSLTMDAHIVAVDADGNQLTCINAQLEIGSTNAGKHLATFTNEDRRRLRSYV